MNCNAVQTRLSAYLDRELTGDELLQLRSHLSQCPECRAEENELRSLKSMLGSLGAPEPSEGFEARLCATVLKDAKQTQPRWTWGKSLATFAGVGAMSMAGTLFLVSFRQDTPELASQPAQKDAVIEIARDQAYEFSSDPTGGSSLSRFANYAGR